MSYDLIIDEKVEVWRRTNVKVNADNLEDAIKKCLKYEYEHVSDKVLYDTEILLDPYCNDGPTVEIYLAESDKYDLIYTNDPNKK